MNMDRFRAPDASDEKARCQGQCQRSMHHTLLVDGYCEDCRNDEDEDNDMTEKEMRALDAWIAEHVMGRRCDCTNGIKKKFGQKEYAAIRATNDIWIKNWPDQEPDLPCDHAPHYTTDPAAAMQVLEKCIELKASPCFDKDNAGNFEIACVDSECQAKFLVRAYTLPLAIALFARKLYETKT